MKTRRNANMVEIANQRMLAIYESIMSEGLLGALGGAAIGGALGAGAGALGGDALKGSNLVQDANTKFDAVTDATKNFDAATKQLTTTTAAQQAADTAASAAKLDLSKIDTTASNDLAYAADSSAFGDAYEQAEAMASQPAMQNDKTADAFKKAFDTQRDLDIANTELKNAKNVHTDATNKLNTAKNNYKTFDKAVKWAGDNPIAAGAAAGAVAGGAIGAFAHDDRKDEADDDILEDDDRLF